MKMKPVQAQRKYAHRAPSNLAEVGQEADPPDVALPGARTTRRPRGCPRLVKTQRHINKTLDIISFQSGIHSHVQRKVPRVVLQRCELEAAARAEPCPAPPQPCTAAPPPPPAQPPTPPPAYQPPPPARPTSALCLRNRTVSRVARQRGNKKYLKKIPRPAPELAESEEDHPLAYFAKRKASNKKAGPQSSAEIAPAAASPGAFASPSAMSPLVYDESVAGEAEVAHSSRSAPVSLYDFIINIFDWREAELCEINDVETEANAAETIARVSDWLTRVEHGGATPSAGNNFKMPELPSWRVCPSHTDASSVVSRVPPPTRGEKLLRATCISWHHRHLCATLQDASYITRFCGECPRCRLMFKSLKSPLPTDTDDIMYDEARHIHFASTLANAASEEHSGAALKRLLTRNGKKIFKVALMLRGKSTNSGFTDSEQALVAAVITCLTECNAARPPPREPGLAPPAIKRLNVLCLEESPIFTVSEADFAQSPTDYSNKILSKFPKTSLCGIRPPDSFQPGAVSARSDETEQNFRVNNMYIHRMMMRMGPATKELVAIRRIQSSNYQRSPLFDGLEIDLVKLFHMVQREGGIEAVQANEENWKKIARQMGLVCRNKTYSKLENIYFKYLLEWSSLRSDERQEAIKEVEECWSFRESNAMMRAQQPLRRQERMDLGVPDDDSEVPLPLEAACAEAEECVTLGRNINIKAYKKLAEQVRLNHFDGCSGGVEEVEQRYWQLVSRADSHVCVHAGSVDAAAHDTGFPKDQASPYVMHPWNLKRVRFSNDNLLRYLGPCLGVSSSSIHYGMCFSTSCWHMDPTSVPWIEYLHEGAPKIWYSIAADQAPAFRKAAEAICPWAVLNKEIWLPSDLIMIPPKTLKEFGVQVHRHVQQPGEYVLVYPNTYSANICTGYTVSEGVYFAPYSWITSIETTFNKLRLSCEPSLFPMERLLISMAANERTSRPLQLLIQPVLAATFKQELSDRQRLIEKNMRLMSDEAFLEQNMRRGSRQLQQNGECAYCRRHLFLSRVVGVVEGDLCSKHGLALYEQALARQERLDNATCILMVSNALMTEIINSLKQRILGVVTNPEQ